MPEPTDPWATHPTPGDADPTERLDLPYESDAISSGEPATRPAEGRLRRGLLPAGIAVLALVTAGAVGVALAHGSNDGGQPSAVAATGGSTASPDSPQRGWREGPHGMGGLMGLAGAVHGELVVPDGSGGYRTVVIQRGKVTDVGSDTLSVKSDDGYTASYDVPSGAVVGALREGLGSVKSGDQVVVVADKSGSTLTARSVIDVDSVRRGMGGFMRGPGGMGPFGDDDDSNGSSGNRGDGGDGGSTDTQGTSFGI